MRAPSSRSTQIELAVTLKDTITMLGFPFRKDREFLRLFKTILGFYPYDINLYKRALLHKSLSMRGGQGQKLNNERLEFLGDAILDAVVADIVYRRFPKKPEGFLTNTRSKIVRREALNKIAVEMGLDKLIKSDGHVQNSHNSYVCGNAFEALIGAIYIDRGYGTCLRFVRKRILQRLINIDKIAYKEQNFKSKLIEWGQKNKIAITFQLVEEEMENGYTPTFLTHAIVEGIVCGEGKGYSKKESQQLAAKDAFFRLKKQKELEEKVFAAKQKRTATEEEAVALLPDIPEDTPQEKRQEQVSQDNDTRPDTTAGDPMAMDFPDVSPWQKTREEIISEAEELAQKGTDN